MTISTGPRFIPPYFPKKESYKPTHPELFLIEFGGEEDYSSCLRTQRTFKAGEVICPIINTIPGLKRYSSVQVLPDPPIPTFSQDVNKPRHIELQSDLLYVNHSCDPNVAFEVNGDEWKVRALKDLKEGEIMTFAYFSTEWEMSQPFQCLCGSSKCLKTIDGAKNISQEVLATYQINDHIKALKAYQLSNLNNGLASTLKSKVQNGVGSAAQATVA